MNSPHRMLMLAAMLQASLACTNVSEQRTNYRSTNRSPSLAVGSKTLSAELSLDQAGLSLTEGALAALSIVGAYGRVPGCVDQEAILSLVNNMASIEVPVSCLSTDIEVTQVAVSVAGLVGSVALKQGQAKSISPTLGSWILSGAVIKRLSGRFSDSVTINRDATNLSAALSIDGALECNELSVRNLSQTEVQVDLLGSFPSNAVGSQTALRFLGVSGNDKQKTASWNLAIPLSSADGTVTYQEQLSWSDSAGLEKTCTVAATITLNSSVVIEQAPPASCPVASGFLCTNVDGFGSSPSNYCTMDRLAAVTSIPELCPIGSCLMVVTMPDNVISAATCWDIANAQPSSTF